MKQRPVAAPRQDARLLRTRRARRPWGRRPVLREIERPPPPLERVSGAAAVVLESSPRKSTSHGGRTR